MAGAGWGMQFLRPVMSKLTMKPSPTIWDTSALGMPAAGSSLGLNFAGAPATAQVHIIWQVILMDVVQSLGGSQPVFTRQDAMDFMFQFHVSFRLPLNTSGSSFIDIAAVGKKCSTLVEAQSEASAAAFQELQHGCLSMRIFDVSRIRSKELEEKCHEILTNTSGLYDVVQSLLSGWDDGMDKIERCYSPGRTKVGENICHTMQKTYGDIIPDVADELAKSMRIQYLKLKELASETEKVKISIDTVRDRVEYFFCEAPLDQTNEHSGELPREIKLRMSLILQGMMISLGWTCPSFNVTCLGTGLYVCETSLFPNHVHTSAVPKTLSINGAECSSKEEAIESSCKAAISALEIEKSICLVDLNYNHRSHGELYVVEARDAARSASFMGSMVLSRWEAMVDELHKCVEYCQKLAVEHSQEEQSNFAYNMKCSTAKAVTALHRACAANLQLGKDRLQNATAWIGE